MSKPEFSDDLNACAALVQKGDPDRFRYAMAAAVSARAVLFPIYAFNVEVARAPWLTKEPMIAEMRLQWWRDALGEIADRGIVRRHEVVTPLAQVLTPALANDLDRLVAARRWDIYRDPFEDAAHFTQYLEETAGHLTYAAACALGNAPRDVAIDAGYAMGLASYFAAIPELENQGRKPLVDGRPEAIWALAADGLARLKRARAQSSAVSANARPAFLGARKAEKVLKQVVKTPALVAEGALGLSGLSETAMLGWSSLSGRW
ncbi:MAG: squalene/phytoene synthase family protein [Thalassococcus sp.]|uniref:squalene/phytoene synthase family protein n=1 Tax=Thalassococcus sp. TaxID=1928858 RepID=UPI001B150E41|nr:squalene/phytoene synthase family protein [Thalassococcus sp.]MBO6868337.1 squalene/phytoene synthase family protein [Thalassococcus sp.]